MLKCFCCLDWIAFWQGGHYFFFDQLPLLPGLLVLPLLLMLLWLLLAGEAIIPLLSLRWYANHQLKRLGDHCPHNRSRREMS